MATSTYLTRTGTSGNQKTFTFAGWFKIQPEVQNFCWTAGIYGSTIMSQCYFESDGTFVINHFNATPTQLYNLVTDRLFRDPAAWYHVVVAMDTTQSVAADRTKIYINGVQETSFSTETYPVQDYDTAFNSTLTQSIGRRDGSTTYFDGVMAHLHAADGLAYAPTVFGEVDSTSGIWIAKSGPSVTYGTNGGFYKFASGALGTDSSGEGNTMTVTGTMTTTKDTPDNNFCTLNPLVRQVAEETSGLSSGNTEVLFSGASWGGVTSTVAPSTGKWYFESKLVALGSNAIIGVAPADSQGKDNTSTWYIGQYSGEQGYQNNGAASNGGAGFGDTYTSADILGVALDCDNAKVYFSKNGVFQNSGDPSSGATGTGAMSLTADKFYTPAVTGNGVSNWEMNFGNGYFGTTSHGETNADDAGIGLFKYDVPAGYYALCTNNLGDQS